MSTFTGVISVSQALDRGFLKRLALMFDRIGIYNLKTFSAFIVEGIEQKPENWDEIAWLCDKGVIQDVPHPSLVMPLYQTHPPDVADFIFERLGYSPAQMLAQKQYHDRWQGLLANPEYSQIISAFDAETLGDWSERGEALRAGALWLRAISCVDAVPVLSSFSPGAWQSSTKADVARLLLAELPQPAELVDWEQILDFRANDEVRAKFSLLKRWVNELAATAIPLPEAADAYRALAADYEAALRTARVKLEKTTVEIFLTTVGDFLENLSKLKLGKLAALPFQIKKERMSLYEAEQKAPGRELAYLINAKKQFGP